MLSKGNSNLKVLISILMIAGAFTTSSCQFKKKNIEDETIENVGEIKKQLSDQKEELSKTNVTDSEVKFYFTETKEAYKYIGTLELPDRVERMNFTIYSANKKLSEEWKVLERKNSYAGNRYTFNADSTWSYKVEVTAVSNISKGELILKEETAPLDKVYSGNLTLGEAEKSVVIDAHRIFIKKNSVIRLVGISIVLKADKIISSYPSKLTNISDDRSEDGKRNAQTSLTIQAEEVIGSLRIELKGVDGIKGKSGDQLRSEDKNGIYPARRATQDGENGTDNELSIAETECHASTEGKKYCLPKLVICKTPPTDGTDGSPGEPGIKASDSISGGPSGDLNISIYKDSSKASISYSVVGGNGVEGAKDEEPIPPGKPGLAGKAEAKNEWLLNPCPAAKDGKPGEPAPPAGFGKPGNPGADGLVILSPSNARGVFLKEEDHVFRNNFFDGEYIF